MRLRWSALARQGREQIYDHIRSDNPKAAILVAERIVTQSRRLLDFSGSGRPGRVADTGELVIPGTSHILVYRELPGIIRILRVLHAAQSWPDVFGD